MDGDGVVDLEELKGAMLEAGLPCAPENVQAMMDLLDTSKDGVISPEEWENADFTFSPSPPPPPSFFAKVDTDGDGEISKDELRRLWSFVGMSVLSTPRSPKKKPGENTGPVVV